MDIFAMVTDKIIAALEQGFIPWKQPWIGSNKDLAVSHTTGKAYSLLNQMLLLVCKDSLGAGEYLTFKQAQDEGGYVRKGQKGHAIVFWKWLDKKDEDGSIILDENGKPERIPLLKHYTVFHISQCEGIEPRHTRAPEEMPGVALKPDDKAQQIVKDYIDRSKVKLTIRNSSQAYYKPLLDEVVVPCMDQYASIAEYYSTLFHELTHSTGHRTRLNRITEMAAFGSESYSKEELVAQMGAAFLCNTCGIDTAESFTNSTAYIQNWLKVLKDDKKLIVSAAGRAEKAVRLILNEKEEQEHSSDDKEAH